jgi:hypothetical protein
MLSGAYRIGRGEHGARNWTRAEYALICGIQSARRLILWIPETAHRRRLTGHLREENELKNRTRIRDRQGNGTALSAHTHSGLSRCFARYKSKVEPEKLRTQERKGRRTSCGRAP